MYGFDNNIMHCPRTITHAVHNAAMGGKRLLLPRVPISSFKLYGVYTVTDAGISAGENFAGLLDTLKIVADGKTIFGPVKTNEIINAATLMHKGLVTGQYSDGDPTTATEQQFYYTFMFPHDLSGYSNVYIELSLRAPSSEWGGASAFTCEIGAQVEADSAMKGVRTVLRRFDSPTSSTLHEITDGVEDGDLIFGVFAVLSTSYISEAYVGTTDKKDVEYTKAQTTYTLSQEWAEHTQTAFTSGTNTTNLIAGFQSAPRPGRLVSIRMASAGTISYGFVLGIAPGYVRK